MHDSVSTPGSSGSLIERIRATDRRAWEQFVDIYGPLIHRWCLQCGLTTADAADQTQEVFAQVLKSIHRYQRKPGATFRAWLWVVTRNRVRDFLRQQPEQLLPTGGTTFHRRMNEIADPIDVFDEESVVDPTGQSLASSLMRRALESIRSEFAENTWQAFWRSAVESQKTAVVAEELGMSTNSVRQAKSRVLRRLRLQMGEI
jgi:RNA polymerase sigma-70 factor, ECF subfamily